MTGPLLIYHSEIPDTATDNGLICSHPTRTDVAWHLTNGVRLIQSGGTFNNRITNEGRLAQLMRSTHNRDESSFDGLWTCRLNGGTGAVAFHVGIYDDTPTTGKFNLICSTSQMYNFCVSIINLAPNITPSPCNRLFRLHHCQLYYGLGVRLGVNTVQ